MQEISLNDPKENAFLKVIQARKTILFYHI